MSLQDERIRITAEITGIKYVPKLGRTLHEFYISSLAEALSTDVSFFRNG